MSTLSLQELSVESAELLPTRETLQWGHFSFNFADVAASNSSLSLNALTALSVAYSGATQTIIVAQG